MAVLVCGFSLVQLSLKGIEMSFTTTLQIDHAKMDLLYAHVAGHSTGKVTLHSTKFNNSVHCNSFPEIYVSSRALLLKDATIIGL